MSEKILIQFKASGDARLRASMIKLAASQAVLEKNTRQFRKSLTDLTKGFQTHERRLRNTSGAFSTLRSQMLLFSFAMSLGGRQLTQFAKQAAQVEGMETAFNTLSGGAGNASVAIEKLTDATDGTMSNFDLFQQANNAMVLGITKNSDEMASMFDMAQRLGKALGVDTKRSVESLVTGIGRQSRLMLDNIGIIVKSDEAYEAYAKELDKSKDELTDLEKKQAFLNATLEAGREKLEKIGKEPETAIDSFNRLEASWSNFTDEVGAASLDIFQPLMEMTAELLKAFNEEKIKTYSIALAVVAAHYGLVRVSTMKAATATKIFDKALKGTGYGLALAGIAILIDKLGVFKDTTDEALAVNVDGFGKFNNAVIASRGELEGLEKVASDVASEIELLEAQQKMMTTTTQILTGVTNKAVEANKGLGVSLNLQTAFSNTLEAVDNETQATRDLNEAKLIQEKIEEKIASAKANNIAQSSALLPAIENEIAMLELQQEFQGTQLAIEQAVLEAKQKGLEFVEKDFRAAIERKEILKKEIEDEAAATAKAEKDKQDAIKATEDLRKKQMDLTADAIKEGIQNNARFAESFGQMIQNMAADIVANMASFILFNIFSGKGTLTLIKEAFAFAKGQVLHDGGQVQGYNTGGMVPLQGYATGGGVDDVPAMLQEGEFVMRRSAVESIGIENLNRMNRTGQVSGGVNINFTGNVLSRDFIEDEAVPLIKNALRKGGDLGLA